jgi:hypothetical protein
VSCLKDEGDLLGIAGLDRLTRIYHKITKYQITSTKLQTNLKFQYWSSGLPTLRAGPQFQMTKTQNRFEISNFGHCDLFDICYL